MRNLAVIFIFFLYLVIRATGQEQELYKYLMQNYNKDVRPVRIVDDVTQVVFHPTLEFLVEVDELQESFTALLWFSMLWYDNFLVWNASDFVGIDKIHLPAKAIWRPDLIVYGAIKTEFALALEDTVAVVQANGYVKMELVQVMQLYCPFDIELFPFDKQNCTMEFGSWTYSSDSITFTPLKEDGNTEYLRDHPEWEVVSFKANLLQDIYELGDSFKNETFSELSYHFVFKRKPTYYIFYLVLPSFLITFLSLIGLFAPFSSTGERQEKVTLGLTSLLAMALVLDLVSKEVPKTSKGIPILGRFILYELTIIALAALTTVAIISAHRAAMLRKKQPPNWLLRLMLLKHAGRKRKSYWFNHYMDGFEPGRANEDNKSIDTQGPLGRLLADLASCRAHLYTIAYATNQKKQKWRSTELWIMIFDRVDQFCLLLYSLGNIIMTFTVLIGR